MNKILEIFDFNPGECEIEPLNVGLINTTQIVTNVQTNKRYILQKINTNVFKSPQNISYNILTIGKYLKSRCPDYLFTYPVLTSYGKDMISYEGAYYRMFPYIENSKTYTTLSHPDYAFEAAKQFGAFTSVLSGLDIRDLKITIADFHNLELRFKQFEEASSKTITRTEIAQNEILFLKNNISIVDQYRKAVNSDVFRLRVTHHDTKISNVLFNQDSKGLCVIDLDTVMPGYFISDVGDMCRTYLSAYSEEEKDLSNVNVRTEYFEAIAKGYLSEMNNNLTGEEKEYFVYAGEFIIYMQALRFLTDYLNEDVYYQVTYPEQNLVRAKNQIKLLQSYQSKKEIFQQIVQKYF
jgi:thiamine kinase-like enzyme